MPAATTAVLHGMMATLSEVLGGIDGRIAALERQLREARAESGSPLALAQTVEAAVARLAERIEALEALTTAAAARPTRDDDLHAAVDALRHSVDALAVRPVRDDDLHASVASVTAAVAALAARPDPVPALVRDDDLHAAVSALAAQVAAIPEPAAPPPPPPPAPPPPPDDLLRQGVTSLHERLNVLLDVVSRPPNPDDAVRAGLAAVEAELAALREQVAAPTLELGERVRQWAERAESAGEDTSTALRLAAARMGELHEAVDRLPDALAAAVPDQSAPLAAGLAGVTTDLAGVAADLAGLGAELAAVRDALAGHPAAHLTEAMARVEEQVASLVAQPGPGPAMAMIAAGLAERFESRTDDVVARLAATSDALGHVATTPAAIAALGERLEEIAAAAAALPDAVTSATVDLPRFVASATAADREAVLARLDQVAQAALELPGRLAPDRDAVLARLDDLAGNLATSLAAATDPTPVLERVDALGAAVAALANQPSTTAETDEHLARLRTVLEGQQGDVAAMRDAVRSLYDSVERHGAVSGQVAELLLENRAALGKEVDRLQQTVGLQSSDTAERLRQALDAVAHLDARVAGAVEQVARTVDNSMQTVRADVQAMAATGKSDDQLEAVAARVAESLRHDTEALRGDTEALRADNERLAQGLDALASAVADLRAAVDSTLTRKAGEVGRRLVADLGIRPGRKS
jgi:hypothetical protein